jgi:GntR family transcriptional repressor for pyruvate dehydrogenase complex
VQADKGKGESLANAETDLEFHLAVADASHNVALMHVMRGLFNLLRTSTYRFRELIFSMRDGSDRLLHDQHRAIYEAVMKGAPETAREAAHLHLSFLEATLREADSARSSVERSGSKLKARARGAAGSAGRSGR